MKRINKTNCPNCGAVIDYSKSKCEYCGTPYVFSDHSHSDMIEITSHGDNSRHFVEPPADDIDVRIALKACGMFTDYQIDEIINSNLGNLKKYGCMILPKGIEAEII